LEKGSSLGGRKRGSGHFPNIKGNWESERGRELILMIKERTGGGGNAQNLTKALSFFPAQVWKGETTPFRGEKGFLPLWGEKKRKSIHKRN